MLAKRLIKSNDAGGGCTDTVDLYNPFPDGGGVALYQLNGNATDVSGNYDGTATNVTYDAGQFGQAGVFSSSTSKINIPQTYGAEGEQFSYSLWFKTSVANGSYMFAKRNGNNTFHIRIDNSFSPAGKICVNNWAGTAQPVNNAQSTNGGYNDNTWHNFVFTYDGTRNPKTQCYIDGQRDTNMNWDYDLFTQSVTNGNNIGNYDLNGANFSGSIDQVRIFSRALRPYEVEALYTEEYCTPTIVPSEHFNTVLYTGNGGTQSITGVGFQPDFVWAKKRSAVQDHIINDSVRGVQKELVPNNTSAEYTTSNGLSSFDSDGFTTGANNALNTSGATYASWNFKAGGAAVTNTDGTITSQVSANTEAGFSVVTFTGTGSAATVGHGLSDAPKMIITKTINNVSTWVTYHSSLGNTKYLELNSTNAAATSSGVWNNTSPNDSVFTVGSGYGASNWLAYCFAEVEGFSNFGSYAGTGASGNTVVTGFEPAMVIAKMTSAADSWRMYDNKRIGSEGNGVLYPNSSTSEGNVNHITFLENGFVWNSDNCNSINQDFIYMAFAADPTTIEPSLEDSFNTVLYSGNSSTNAITGVGFQPDFTWIKSRNASWSNVVTDSVTGGGLYLSTNATTAQAANSSAPTFDSDGFTLGGGNTIWNGSGLNYVAWCWKGAEIPAINSNGSIPSVVSANPAAGFSIVSTKSNGSGYLNFGHGLDSAPKLVITKFTSQVGEWYTYTSAIANGFDVALKLNGTDAAITAYGADKWSSTDSVVGVGNSQWYFTANVPFIAYCFAEVAGFSKFGSYTGNGNGSYDSTGTVVAQTITTGFEPAFVMVKRTDAVENWVIADNKRGGGSPGSEWKRLFPNTSVAEVDQSSGGGYSSFVDFISTGFTLGNDPSLQFNASGGTYIYMAFANQF
jgi:hypothetical protein